MLVYLDYQDWDLVLEYLANSIGHSLADLFFGQSRLPIHQVSLDDWNSLDSVLSWSEGLFTDPEPISLVDISNVNLRTNNSQALLKISTNKLVYCHRGTETSLSSEEKKLWDKLGFEYITLKQFSNSTKTFLLDNHLIRFNFNLTNLEKNQLLRQSQNYTELVNLLDLCFLTQNPSWVIENTRESVDIPLFKLPITQKSIASWQQVSEDNLQLALSLFFTKLEKLPQNISKKLQKLLILTDQNLKTKAKVKPTTWWKLFLWQVKQEISN